MSELKDFFLRQKKAVHEGSLSVYSRIPDDQLGYRPHPDMLTLGEILRHCWKSEAGARALALKADWSYHEKRVPGGLPAVLGDVDALNLEAELAALSSTHETTLREVNAFPDERWSEVRDNEAVGMRRPVSVILFGIVEHQIHHRAQASTYLRLLTGNRVSSYPR